MFLQRYNLLFEKTNKKDFYCFFISCPFLRREDLEPLKRGGYRSSFARFYKALRLKECRVPLQGHNLLILLVLVHSFSLAQRKRTKRDIHLLQGLPLYGEDATRKVAETATFLRFGIAGHAICCLSAGALYRGVSHGFVFNTSKMKKNCLKFGYFLDCL